MVLSGGIIPRGLADLIGPETSSGNYGSRPISCPCCGAPAKRHGLECAYCGSLYVIPIRRPVFDHVPASSIRLWAEAMIDDAPGCPSCGETLDGDTLQGDGGTIIAMTRCGHCGYKP